MTTASGPIEDGDYRLEDQVGYLLRCAHQRHTALFAEQIGDRSITPTQFTTLVRLLENGELSQNYLGRLTAMDPATIQGVIRRLAERRLLERRQDPDDRRRTLLRLTQEGRALVRRLIRNGPGVSRATLMPLKPAEQTQFLRLLRRLT